ncbi:MAG: NAD(P)H-dependent amine dehydrogenase family protein [Candidatus Hodarchaeales archaeon]|jgi:4-hydroxy-tetrahydrodipicolinate reductase
MNKSFNVVQIGLGPMGKLITRLLVSRKNINLLGLVDIDPEIEGKSLDDILKISVNPKIIVQKSVKSLLINNQVDVVVIATSSSLINTASTIKEVLAKGVNVISICEELSYPYVNHPELSIELDKLAKENLCTVVGTGINPGYLMDLLPIVMTAPCQIVDKISITRMMNSSKRREPFQRKIGTGLSTDDFQAKIRNKEITGHVGLTESIQMIVGALCLPDGEILENSPEPVVTPANILTSYGESVKQGNVCGLKSSATYKNSETGEIIISMDFIAYAGDHEEYDSIDIEGTPNINQKITGGVHGDLGTAAMVANLVPHVYKSSAGLFTMKDTPVPCNTSNVWKN